jgi:hypothetical protein
MTQRSAAAIATLYLRFGAFAEKTFAGIWLRAKGYREGLSRTPIVRKRSRTPIARRQSRTGNSRKGYRGHPSFGRARLSRRNAHGKRSRTPIARRQSRTGNSRHPSLQAIPDKRNSGRNPGHPPIAPTADTHLSEKSYTSPGFFLQTIFVSPTMISS